MVMSRNLHARCACAGAAAPFALAGTDRQYERARPFEITQLTLAVEPSFETRSIAAVARLRFRRVAPDAKDLVLDARGFDLRRVKVETGGKLAPAHFVYDGDRLSISVPVAAREGRVEIRYRATPRRGLYFLEPDDKVPDRPRQIWTQCQDEDARHWVPCHDKPHVKMTTELTVSLPEGFVALSNGELVRTKQLAGGPWRYTFRLDRPHPSYLLTLVAGEFAVLKDRDAITAAGVVPVQYFVPPGREADAGRAFGETPRMIELFSRLTGVPYPWSRYSQVVVSDFIFGGMENTTATTMYEHVLLDKRAALDVESHDIVAHELAHQWFGDFVTCRDWSHAWLNEGFATFCEVVEREDRLGRDEADYAVESDLEAYLGEATGRYQRPIVCRDYQEPIDLFDRHLYEKGALVLHMLRRELGDDAFWKGVGDYLRGHAYGIVETGDLQRALEAVTGRSLERFFDQWVHRPGHPVLKVKAAWEDGRLVVSVKQTQRVGDAAVFAFPLEIAVGLGDGEVIRVRKEVTELADVLAVPLDERPAWVAFDPDLRVVGSVSWEAPADMLRAQLTRGAPARARWTAAQALARRDDAPTIGALATCLGSAKEEWMVRAEAARALGRIRGDASLEALLGSAADPHPKVRRAVAVALGSFRDVRAAKALTERARKDPSYLVASSAARSLGRTRDPGAFAALMKLLDQPSWADVRRAGAIDGLAALRDERALDPVRARTRYGVPTRGRRAAIAALPEISDARAVRLHLEELLDDRDPHLRIDVVRALAALRDPAVRPALRRQLERELDGRVARRLKEALRDLGRDGAAERGRLRDELEALRGELAEMKTRVAKVEASASGKKRRRSKKAGARRRSGR